MARKHEIKARKPKPQEPEAQIKAPASFYEKTHPVGSAERFLDNAAKEALASAAAGGVLRPQQAAIGAIRAVAKESEKYPDSLLAEAAKLPKEELMKRAARAAAYQEAAKSQNRALESVALVESPMGRMATTLAAADVGEALETQQDALGGDAGTTGETEVPPPDSMQPTQNGPRIVINPTTFRNKKDALCVAFNEGFRLWMEAEKFEPQSEPTDAQRKFFSDTAYADDEVQLRRTILARIATFDTSVKDPTDDQLAETGSFLDAILESDWCKNEWERNCVSRLSQAVKASVGAEPVEPRQEPIEPREPEPLQSRAALGGGETEAERKKKEEEADRQATVPETVPDNTVPDEPDEPQEPGNPDQPEGPAPQDAQGAALEPAATQPGNAPQVQPPGNLGTQSGVWTGGEPGNGRQLTASEAEWMRRRAASGASMSASQRTMLGLG